MASGSVGGYGRGGKSTGRSGRRYTPARNRRLGQRYTAPSRSARRGSGGAVAVPSRWLM